LATCEDQERLSMRRRPRYILVAFHSVQRTVVYKQRGFGRRVRVHLREMIIYYLHAFRLTECQIDH
jgi:hypothetical protein